ncbi:hypothetical protein GCM10011534_04980 [Pseudooceanicola nanhaiensis]|jgi:hypothetical protein|uniref:DUF305 domain-containing protein n=1 Tax=Pseudooceanicola nanhaiensis TaxID=375761 RepID=A0A917WB27_9RHOB|nr:DUF305 domain-containing protein [Pseudooceanicola nanhaiensis]GGL86071.1 hypothetical protein GCM10011534_04980 [Pseudooceanicola nanhaiensis]
MTYTRFALMIATSTVVMFGLMYLNTYAFEHVFYSETRAWMALLMGGTMAFVMMAFMFAMYPNKGANLAILAGAIVIAGVALWLVRSQITVSGPSYMRAMIPHHSIAVMTSERAGIEDPRVRKLADAIIGAQQKEIAEMRYLIADIDENGPASEIYEDPAARPGTVEDALNTTLLGELDPAPLTRDEAGRIITPECGFARTAAADPILWIAEGGAAAMKLNGVLIALEAQEDGQFSAPGVSLRLRDLPDPDWRSNAELVFALENGPTVGYRGFDRCRR